MNRLRSFAQHARCNWLFCVLVVVWVYAVACLCGHLAAFDKKVSLALPDLLTITARDWLPTADARLEGGYWLSYDGRTKTARYVLEILRPDQLEKATERVASFKADPAAPKECRASPRDYEGSGYDKGHLAPAADWAQSAELQAATFILSNAVPQEPACNRIIWRMLETHVRAIAAESQLAIVVTAPVYLSDDGHLTIELVGANQVWKPTHLAKAIIWQHGDGFIESAAWIIPNTTDEDGNFARYQVTVDDFEAAAGVDVFAALPDAIEPSVESTSPPERVQPKK